jgi:hypothetical protein
MSGLLSVECVFLSFMISSFIYFAYRFGRYKALKEIGEMIDNHTKKQEAIESGKKNR